MPTTRSIEAPPVREDGLQLGEDRVLQERFWTGQRVAWGAFALIGLLALSGLSGAGGPLATATRVTPEGELRHPRVARWTRSDEIAVRFAGAADRHRLALSDAFLERFAIEGVQPQPERALAGPEGIVLEFAATGGAGARVALRVRPERPGFARYAVALDGRAPVEVATVILP